MKVLNPELTNWNDVKVSVSVTDLVELLIASHDGVNHDLPDTAGRIIDAQDSARKAIYDSGYWIGEE
tara:strand:- start:584 stop:784 length:201 start_codon:yes stop_codon:yes gene_type:complete